GGFYDLDAGLHTQFRCDVARLPQSELGASGADDDHCGLPKRNNLRIRSDRCAPSGSEAVRRSSLIGPWAILLTMPRVMASIASSCCGVMGPRRARILAISPARTLSSCSCRL